MNELQQMSVDVIGHCHIADDLGNVLLDQKNAIHPQNIARIFARALSREDNYFIHRIAYGNGGTTVDAAFVVTYKSPNDGQTPDVSTWDSRIYNETYSEIIDDLSPIVGSDPGSADLNTGPRSGGGAVPSSDPESIPHVSGPGVRSTENGLTSEVVIHAVLNGNEPLSQFLSDTNATTNKNGVTGDFVFDEIGLYTSGSSAISTSGYQYVDVKTKTADSDTGLQRGEIYNIIVTIDGGDQNTITLIPPTEGGQGVNGAFTYGDLCLAINTSDVLWSITSTATATPGRSALGHAVMTITNPTDGAYLKSYTNSSDPNKVYGTAMAGASTFGYLKISSLASGPTSSVEIMSASTILTDLNPPFTSAPTPAVNGKNSGIQNAPTASTTERERLLTHLIFSPVLKSASRTLQITYTLTISVARTQK